MIASKPVIVWFRQDLRLTDNPALFAAARSGSNVLPLYILDDNNAGEWASGAASRWWLHHSLLQLQESLEGRLVIRRGDASKVLADVLAESGATAVHWNRCYEPWRIKRDSNIRRALQGSGISVKSFNGSQLFEPTAVLKGDGSPYKVFTPYYKNGCLQGGLTPRKPIATPDSFTLLAPANSLTVAQLELLPTKEWYRGIEAEWTPGEQGGRQRLTDFINSGLANYQSGRDRPDQRFVSRLSPHLHFGEISPHEVWHAVGKVNGDEAFAENRDSFLAELGWREFSTYLLYHWPELPEQNLQRKFNRFPWREDTEGLRCWQQGRTGYPIVDAGMRELWQTGFMHNRVRMIVASFLVKNLLLHWRHGADWFWDTLVDADLANNSASWQWVAGSGRDAAPYFRIFNPVTQGKRFDPNGDYVRRFVPEIANLPNKYLQSPWTAPTEVLRAADLDLGRDYPKPILDLKATRERALAAFKSLTPVD